MATEQTPKIMLDMMYVTQNMQAFLGLAPLLRSEIVIMDGL